MKMLPAYTWLNLEGVTTVNTLKFQMVRFGMYIKKTWALYAPTDHVGRFSHKQDLVGMVE